MTPRDLRQRVKSINWADRYPWIVAAALKNRHKQFVVDGEAVLLGIDGLALDGEDL